MKTLSIVALALISANCFASSICIVDSGPDRVVCDGKQVGHNFTDTTEGYTIALKTLADDGYKVISQSTNSQGYTVWTLQK
jgi:hypothetical protein